MRVGVGLYLRRGLVDGLRQLLLGERRLMGDGRSYLVGGDAALHGIGVPRGGRLG